MNDDNKLMEHRLAESLQSQYHVLQLAQELLKTPQVKVNKNLIENYNKGVNQFMENVANIGPIRRIL